MSESVRIDPVPSWSGVDLVAVISVFLIGILARPVAAFPDQITPLEPAWVTKDARSAIDRGLAYLAANQQPDGAWTCDVGFKLFERYEVDTFAEEQQKRGGGHVGVTGLAGIAFIAGGHLPGRGRYGRVVSRALDYVLDQVKPDGYITDHGSRMYSHAFACLFLAEVFGMTRRTEVREKLQASVDLIVRSQNGEGSWRYLPFATESDMSITVCQVMALRAAKNTGIRVPRSTIDDAVDYVRASQIKRGPQHGGFRYQLKSRLQNRTSFALTAAGIATLHNAAVYADEGITRGLEYLGRELSRMDRHRGHYFYYYGHYYAVQAMHIAGSPHWEHYFPAVRAELIEQQNTDGSWDSNVGKAFSTSMAAIILQVPLRYLPIIQR